MRKITIDPEFSKLLPERPIEELEEQILADGQIISPLVVWKDEKLLRLLDGHRRNRVMERHPSLKAPSPIVMEFASRLEAHDWVIHNQRSRRNNTEEEDRYLLGKLYLAHKPKSGQKISSATVAEDAQSASEIAGKEGVSERTVHNSAAFAEAVDGAEEIKEDVLSGEVAATTQDLKEFAELPKRQRKKATTAIKKRKAKSVKKAVKEAEEVELEEDLSIEDIIKQTNSKIESFCRGLTKYYEENCPRDVWIDQWSRYDAALQKVKDACATLRTAKCHAVCPMCEGDGCDTCLQSGRVNKSTYDQAV